MFNKRLMHWSDFKRGMFLGLTLACTMSVLVYSFLYQFPDMYASRHIKNVNDFSFWRNFNYTSTTKNVSDPLPKRNYSYDLTKRRWVQSVECERIFNDDRNEVKIAELLEDRYLNHISSDMFLNLTKNCSKFLHDRFYIIDSLSSEELNFPIAYSIMVHRDVCQFERLLRTIYRPQNFYCIHVDKKMPVVDKNALGAITSCFDNVFISSMSYNIMWGNISIVHAELACMKDLLKRKWKYFINLTGQEFPLKTNLEIVKILKVYNGANDLKISSRNYSERWKMAGVPPDGLTLYKGRTHIVVSRPFVEFAVENKTAVRLLHWLRHTFIPDESFFTTLNFNSHLGIIGSFDGILDKRCIPGFGSSLTRYKRWQHVPKNYSKCYGKFVRLVCIVGTGDLPDLGKRPELFVNKLYWNYHHYVLDCLEELIYNRTVDGLYHKLKLDMAVYQNMYFVNHSIKDTSKEKPCKCAKE